MRLNRTLLTAAAILSGISLMLRTAGKRVPTGTTSRLTEETWRSWS